MARSLANRPARSSVALVATDTMTQEANRLLLHGVVITTPEGYRPGTIELGYALSAQIHVPWSSILRVTRLRPGKYLAEFRASPERDCALLKGFVEVTDTVLPLSPWRSTEGQTCPPGGTT